MRSTLVLLLLVGACTNTQSQDAKDFYDHTQSGTSWQLTIAGGQLVDEAYGSDYYKGACPAFATRTGHVPDGSTDSCEPGCTCSLQFFLDDDGDVGHNYSVDAELTETCSDGSSLQCVSPDPMDGEIGWCTWLSGKIDPSVDPFGDCKYTFTMTETN